MVDEDLPKTLVISRTGTGDGTSISGTGDMLAKTPAGQPDVVQQRWPPWKIVVVRAARVFSQALVSNYAVTNSGLLEWVGVSDPVAAAISSVKVVLIIASSAALGSVLHNTAELLARLDESMPKLRA